jgi:uncharacterized protein DUF1761
MIIGPETFTGVNPWAVVVSAVATMVICFLWYSPLLFARPWMRLMGYDPNDKTAQAKLQKDAGKLYAITFVATIVSAIVLAKIIDLTTVNTIFYGMKVGFFIWLGLVATVQLTGALFTKQPTKLFLINTGYQLACYMTMGAILAKWPHP